MAGKSLFTWTGDWWRAGAGVSLNGTEVTFSGTNGTTAVDEPKAAEVPSVDAFLEVRIRYRSIKSLPIVLQTSQFSGAGGPSTRLGDTPRITYRLPAAPQGRLFATLGVRLTNQEVKRFRPIIRVPEPGLTILHADVHLREGGPKATMWRDGLEEPVYLETYKGDA